MAIAAHCRIQMVRAFGLLALGFGAGCPEAAVEDPPDGCAVPRAPELTVPAGLCGEDAAATTTWDARAGVGYEVELGDGASWTAVDVADGRATSTGLAPGSYRFRIRVVDAACGAGAWRESAPFTVEQGPADPVLVVADRCGLPATAEVRWTAVAGESYEAEIAADGSTWTAAAQPAPGLATATLTAAGSYRWRVRALTATCTTRPFVTSEPFVVSAAPLAPGTLRVEDTCTNEVPLLSFDGGSADHYDVELVDPAGVAHTYLDVTSPLRATDLPALAGDWTWRVHARSASAACAVATSEDATFARELGPVVPVIPFPVAGCVGASIPLVWDEAQTYGAYVVEVDQGAGFSVDGVTAFGPFGALTASAAGTFAWRVTHSAGLCPPAVAASTVTVWDEPPAPADLASAGACVDSAVALTWTPVPGVAAYTVEVDRGSGFSTEDVSDVTAGSATYTPRWRGEATWRVSYTVQSCPSASATASFTVFDLPATPYGLWTEPACAGSPAIVGWAPATPGGTYTVELDVGDGFTTAGVEGVSGTGATVTGPGAGTYAWRVRQQIDGCAPSEPAVGSFEVLAPVVPQQLAAGALASSAGGAEPYRATLAWTDTSPVPSGGYSVALMRDGCDAPPLPGWPRVSHASSVTTPELTAGTYYWRVTPRAHGTCPAGAPSPCASFTVTGAGSGWRGEAGSDLGGHALFLEGSAFGDGLTADSVADFDLAAGPDSALYLAWTTRADGVHDGVTDIYVMRWDGSAWGELAGSATGHGITGDGESCKWPRIAVGSDGLPVVLWLAGSNACLRRFDGTTWVELAGSATLGPGGKCVAGQVFLNWEPVKAADLALDRSNQPVVAMSAQAYRYESYGHGQDFYGMYVARFEDSAWRMVGKREGAYQDYTSPSVVVDGRDRVLVAYLRAATDGGGSPQKYAVQLGLDSPRIGAPDDYRNPPGALASDEEAASGPSLTLDRNDRPVLAWSQGGALWLQRHDGSAWQELAGSATGDGLGRVASTRHRVIVDAENRPVVAWTDQPGPDQPRAVSLVRLEQDGWHGVAGSRGGDGIARTAASPRTTVVATPDGRLVVAWDRPLLRQLVDGGWRELWANHAGGGLVGAGVGRAPRLALDAGGLAAVSWIQEQAAGSALYLRRRAGDGWVELGASAGPGGVAAFTSAPAGVVHALALTALGAPTVAWNEVTLYGVPVEAYVRQWDGATWVERGGSATAPGVSAMGDVRNVAVATRSDGRPAVAFTHWVAASRTYEIFYREFDGVAWGGPDGTGPTTHVGTCGQNPVLVVDADDAPVLGWEQISCAGGSTSEIAVARWDGAAWTGYGGTITGISGAGVVGGPTLAIDDAGAPTVAWMARVSDGDVTRRRHFLRRWGGDAWDELGASASGDGLTGDVASSAFSRLALALDRDGRPVIAWSDVVGGQSQVFLRRWDGAAWVEVDGSASGRGLSNSNASASFPVLAVGGGRICVVWQQPAIAPGDVVMRCHDE